MLLVFVTLLYFYITLTSSGFEVRMSSFLSLQEQSMSCIQLFRLIQVWDPRSQISDLTKRVRFKYPVYCLANLPERFLINSIYYSLLEEVYWIFKDRELQLPRQLIKANYQMKNEYLKMTLQTSKVAQIKGDFKFQFMILLIVKLALSFIQQHFEEINCESDLESQLFIILIHALLGLQMGPASYRSLLQKYTILNVPPTKSQILILSRNASLRQGNTIVNTTQKIGTQKSMGKMQSKQLDKKNTFRQSFVDEIENQNPIKFIKQVRKTLHVPTLPQVQIQKMSFREIGLQRETLSGKCSPKTFEQLQDTMKKKTIKNTAISTSLQSLMTKNDYQIPKYIKQFHLSHRSQCISRHYQTVTQGKPKPIKETTFYQQKIEKSRLASNKEKKVQHTYWREIINLMKKKCQTTLKNHKQTAIICQSRSAIQYSKESPVDNTKFFMK